MIFTLKNLTACCDQRGSLMFCITYKNGRCVKGGQLEGTRVNFKLKSQKRVRRGKNKSDTMFTLSHKV
jgi:hypothetical protein